MLSVSFPLAAPTLFFPFTVSQETPRTLCLEVKGRKRFNSFHDKFRYYVVGQDVLSNSQ